jgi:hypothetical protein
MNRIIIDNRTDLSDSNAVRMVLRVIDAGRISKVEKQYCYFTGLFPLDGKEYIVSPHINKKSERFVVTEDRNVYSD